MTEEPTKRCRVCGETKPLDRYARDAKKAGGIRSLCKDCDNASRRKRRRDNIKEERERARIRYAENIDENRIKRAECYYKNRDERIRQAVEWSKNNRDKRRKYSKKEYYADPIKTKARRDSSNAIRDKRLIPGPCEVCGSLKVEGHHDDYNKPLDIRWLCKGHHQEVHRKHKGLFDRYCGSTASSSSPTLEA